MNKYLVHFYTTTMYDVEIEAESDEDAIEAVERHQDFEWEDVVEEEEQNIECYVTGVEELEVEDE